MTTDKKIKLLMKKVIDLEQNQKLIIKLIDMIGAYSVHNYQLIKRFHDVSKKGGEK